MSPDLPADRARILTPSPDPANPSLQHFAESARILRPSHGQHFQRAMMMDIDQAAKAMRDEEMLAEIEDFIEG